MRRFNYQYPLAVLCGLLLLCAGTTGCSDDLSQGESNQHQSNQQGSNDAADTDVEDASEANQGDENGDDELPERWEDCECPGEDEACINDLDDDPRCGLPGETCDPDGEDCPEGYSCEYTGGDLDACVCEGGSDECFPTCDTWEDCPDGQCHPDKDICRGRAECSICPEGYICQNPEHPNFYENEFCVETEGRELGEDCEEGMDCNTGICIDGECAEPCLTNADCGDGEACGPASGGDDDGCREIQEGPSSAGCIAECGPDEICVGSGCYEPTCYSTEDCETGDCRFPPPLYSRGSGGGLCEEPDDSDVERYCKPDEVLITSHCRRIEPCWEDDECEDIYDECHDDMNLCTRDAEVLSE